MNVLAGVRHRHTLPGNTADAVDVLDIPDEAGLKNRVLKADVCA